MNSVEHGRHSYFDSSIFSFSNESRVLKRAWICKVADLFNESSNLLRQHASLEICVPDSQEKIQEVYLEIQASNPPRELTFITHEQCAKIMLLVRSAILRSTENLSDGSTQIEYASGLQETIFEHNENGTYRALRVFQDGSSEEGIMNAESHFLRAGYTSLAKICKKIFVKSYEGNGSFPHISFFYI